MGRTEGDGARLTGEGHRWGVSGWDERVVVRREGQLRREGLNGGASCQAARSSPPAHCPFLAQTVGRANLHLQVTFLPGRRRRSPPRRRLSAHDRQTLRQTSSTLDRPTSHGHQSGPLPARARVPQRRGDAARLPRDRRTRPRHRCARAWLPSFRSPVRAETDALHRTTLLDPLTPGIFLLYSQTSAAVEHTVVLVGPAGAGKTALFAAVRPFPLLVAQPDGRVA